MILLNLITVLAFSYFQEKGAEILMKEFRGQEEHLAHLLSIGLKIHCDLVGTFQHGHVTLQDLLFWRLWPIYITLCSKTLYYLSSEIFKMI